MKWLTSHPVLASLGVMTILWPTLSLAQQSGGEGPPTRQQLEDAYTACGGPPIQGGVHVQPTPERDRCLEEHLHRKSPTQGDQQATRPQTRGQTTTETQPQARSQR